MLQSSLSLNKPWRISTPAGRIVLETQNGMVKMATITQVTATLIKDRWYRHNVPVMCDSCGAYQTVVWVTATQLALCAECVRQMVNGVNDAPKVAVVVWNGGTDGYAIYYDGHKVAEYIANRADAEAIAQLITERGSADNA